MSSETSIQHKRPLCSHSTARARCASISRIPTRLCGRADTCTKASQEAFEVVRFRVELGWREASGLPLRNTGVTIAPVKECSAADISVGNRLYSVTHDTPAQLTTDANGKL